jgi:hypothetical protein
MALRKNDPIPKGLSLSENYTAVRDWYQQHPDPNGPWSDRRCSQNYSRISVSLINALPPANKCTDVEKIAVLREILRGHLEWGFHQNDGEYKMGAYAVDYLSYSFTDNDKAQLENSALRPYLSPGAI